MARKYANEARDEERRISHTCGARGVSNVGNVIAAASATICKAAEPAVVLASTAQGEEGSISVEFFFFFFFF